MKRIYPLFVPCLLMFFSEASASVLWMDQAQRLQEVSATLLDTMPVARPLSVGLALGIRSDLSFLPTPNPRVGGKTEKLPSSPVQSIPAVYSAAGLPLGDRESVGLEVWAGVLPRGVEKLMGIEASLFQYQWGVRTQAASARAGNARLSVGAGMARTNSKISGRMSSAIGTDTFTSAHRMSFLEANIEHAPTGVWAGMLVGTKQTASRLAIAEDATDLSLTDTLANAGQPYWSQYTVGLSTSGGWSFALSELIVPSRIEMPRLSVSWKMISR